MNIRPNTTHKRMYEKMRYPAFMFSFALILGCCCSLNGCSPAEKEQQEEKKQEEKKDTEFSLADGRIKMAATGDWKKIEPKFRMINVEFSVPTEVEGQPDGRITMMGAGGSIEANIDRWSAQFVQPDDSETKPKIKEETVAKQDVTFVDISGTYLDKPIPIKPDFTERKDYRMLAAIIETDGMGNYFVKFYGNKKTVDKHEKAFYKMINSMKIED